VTALIWPSPETPRRFEDLSRATVLGLIVPVATTTRARLLGLALLSRERAGPGLLLPRCRSVHTFGMRFALDLTFLDGEGRSITRWAAVPPRRVAFERRAAAVLEVPSSKQWAG
jgi:uncharacterized membrane protein (UPF0127 family)